MLILTRRIDEAVFIGKDIKIILLSSKNGYAKLGFEAPEHIAIHREEVLEKILAAEQQDNASEKRTS